MAKPKKNKSKNKPNNNGYFYQNSQKFGPDFLRQKRVDDLRKDAPRIFKDIAFSGGFVGSITHYFLTYNFVKNMQTVSANMQREAAATAIGLQTYIQQSQTQGLPVDKHLQTTYDTKRQLADAYKIIYDGFSTLLQVIDSSSPRSGFCKFVDAGSVLKEISYKLKPYKYIL